MKVEFEKEYLRELYENGKTTDKKHRFQPQIVNGYLKCVRALYKAVRMEDLLLIRSLNYEKLKGIKRDFLPCVSTINTASNFMRYTVQTIYLKLKFVH
jgi:plasmid maintenance system killer protein